MTSTVTVLQATADDLHVLAKLINSAYEVETGDTGVAFKHTLRLVDPTIELLPIILEGKALKALLPDGRLGGCLVWEKTSTSTSAVVEKNDEGVAQPTGAGASSENATTSIPSVITRFHFGPFAVDPSMQKKGIGKALLEEVYSLGRKAGAVSVDIDVVHHRSDILPLYKKLGYVEYGEAPFPAPDRITRPSHFILLRKPL